MRAVIQRVKDAWITVNGGEKQEMGPGLVVLFVREGDVPEDTLAVANKISQLRIFEDSDGKMNLGPLELGMDCMVVSQFTLFADTKKGRRPSFVKAARPEVTYRRSRSGSGFPSGRGIFHKRDRRWLQNRFRRQREPLPGF